MRLLETQNAEKHGHGMEEKLELGKQYLNTAQITGVFPVHVVHKFSFLFYTV